MGTTYNRPCQLLVNMDCVGAAQACPNWKFEVKLHLVFKSVLSKAGQVLLILVLRVTVLENSGTDGTSTGTPKVKAFSKAALA